VARDGREGRELHFLIHLFRGLSIFVRAKIAPCQDEGSRPKISLTSLVIAE